MSVGVCDILCVPFKSKVSIPYSPLALPKVSTYDLQRLMFWGLTFSGQEPQAEEPDMRLGPLGPWGESLQLYLSLRSWVIHWGT